MSQRVLKPKLTIKQWELYTAFRDDKLKEILFWGWARWGKTWGVAEIVNLTCCALPWIVRLVWRKELGDLMGTTVVTLKKVFKEHWMVEKTKRSQKNRDYDVKLWNKMITYSNGSKILLTRLKREPSDLEFDWLWWYEITYYRIDEAQQVARRAIDVLNTRMTEKINEYNLVWKGILTCNPRKWHLYNKFIKPQSEGTIEPHRKFITSLYTDNPYIDHQKYRDNYKDANKVTRERLLNGNRDYDNTPWRLFQYDDILDLWTNPKNWSKRYLIWDPARLWEDRAVISYWEWFVLKKWTVFKKCTLDQYEAEVKKQAQQYKINMKHVRIDMDWLGGGVVDNLKCKWFANNGSVVKTPYLKKQWFKVNYQNLKTQCAFKLSDMITQISIEDTAYQEMVQEELDVMCEIDLDWDVRKIISKEDVKELIWRSPNFFDCMMMRMRPELWDSKKVNIF